MKTIYASYGSIQMFHSESIEDGFELLESMEDVATGSLLVFITNTTTHFIAAIKMLQAYQKKNC